nr:T9SS type A sorting domain-containing protein [uncultured Draconibacterium sp.]
MKRIIILVLLASSMITASSQQMKFDWISQAGGQGWDIVTAINELPDGQLVLAGTFYESIFFGKDTLNSAGSRDVFIAKYKPDGTINKVITFGGAGYDYAKLIALEAGNGIIVPVKFYDELKISEKRFEGTLPVNIMLSWFDDSFELTQSLQLACTEEFDITGLHAAEDGSCYFSGWFTDTLQIKQNVYQSQSDKDIFVGKVSDQGELQWMKLFKGEGEDIPNSIVNHSPGKLLLSGITSNGCFGSKMNPKSNVGEAKYLFTAELDSEGEVIDVCYHLEGAEIFAVDLLADSTSVWILANFKGSLRESKQTGVTVATGKSDVLLLRYDLLEKTQKKCQLGGGGSETANTLIKSGDNLLITGQYSGTINFGLATIESNKKGTDVFIAMVSDDCIPVNIFALSGENDEFPCSAFASSSGVYVSGEFKGKMNTGNGELLSAGKEDIFLARVENCNAKNPLKIKSTVLDENTNEFVWELDAGSGFVDYSWDNGLSTSRYFVTNETGKYTVTVNDFFGCTYNAEVELIAEKSSSLPLNQDETEFKIYPTVTTGSVYWEPASVWENKQAVVTVFDATGKMVMKQEPGLLIQQAYSLDLSGEAEGVYMIEISGEGFREISKVMVKN